MTSQGQMIEANGISLYVEERGEGTPVLMLHGWPDSARLWRHQVPRWRRSPRRRWVSGRLGITISTASG